MRERNTINQRIGRVGRKEKKLGNCFVYWESQTVLKST
jgi:hypothetical protein